MTLNKVKLSYVRDLQKRMYFPNDEFISALFILEKFLFDNYCFVEEVPIKIIKQKWIYESIEKDDYTNNITKTFEVFKDVKLKNKILDLIETFSALPDVDNKKEFLEKFEKFNKKFNLLINIKNSSFMTSIMFQFTLLTYLKKFDTNNWLYDEYFGDDESRDLFEIVFIEIFKKKKIFNISKSYYLFKIFLKLIKR